MSWWDRFVGPIKDFWDWVTGADVPDWVPDLADKLWDAIVEYIWNPVRGFFESMIGGLWLVYLQLVSIAKQVEIWGRSILARVEDRLDFIGTLVDVLYDSVFNILSNLPDLVASAIVRGFRDWIEPVLNLLEDWIDDNWD